MILCPCLCSYSDYNVILKTFSFTYILTYNCSLYLISAPLFFHIMYSPVLLICCHIHSRENSLPKQNLMTCKQLHMNLFLRATLGMYYRSLLLYLVSGTKKALSAQGPASAANREECLNVWSTAIKVFCTLVGTLKKYDTRNLLGPCLKVIFSSSSHNGTIKCNSSPSRGNCNNNSNLYCYC